MNHNYKFEVQGGVTFLVLDGRKLGAVDEFVMEDRFVTFKFRGRVVRQHKRKAY